MDGIACARPLNLLSRMTAEEQSHLYAIARQREFRKKELIVRAAAPSRHVYVLLKGRVRIYRLSPVGKKVIFWFCLPGEPFGLADQLNSGVHKVYAEACDSAEALAIERKQFRQFLVEHPRLSIDVLDLMSYRLCALGDMLINLSSDDVTTRVVKLLARLSSLYGRQAGNESCLDIPLTHQEIADMVGTARQTVSTILGQLKCKGLVRTQGRSIYIQACDDFLVMSEAVFASDQPGRASL